MQLITLSVWRLQAKLLNFAPHSLCVMECTPFDDSVREYRAERLPRCWLEVNHESAYQRGFWETVKQSLQNLIITKKPTHINNNIINNCNCTMGHRHTELVTLCINLMSVVMATSKKVGIKVQNGIYYYGPPGDQAIIITLPLCNLPSTCRTSGRMLEVLAWRHYSAWRRHRWWWAA